MWLEHFLYIILYVVGEYGFIAWKESVDKYRHFLSSLVLWKMCVNLTCAHKYLVFFFLFIFHCPHAGVATQCSMFEPSCESVSACACRIGFRHNRWNRLCVICDWVKCHGFSLQSVTTSSLHKPTRPQILAAQPEAVDLSALHTLFYNHKTKRMLTQMWRCSQNVCFYRCHDVITEAEAEHGSQ